MLAAKRDEYREIYKRMASRSDVRVWSSKDAGGTPRAVLTLIAVAIITGPPWFSMRYKTCFDIFACLQKSFWFFATSSASLSVLR